MAEVTFTHGSPGGRGSSALGKLDQFEGGGGSIYFYFHKWPLLCGVEGLV
jgi:hypothetical protein